MLELDRVVGAGIENNIGGLVLDFAPDEGDLLGRDDVARPEVL